MCGLTVLTGNVPDYQPTGVCVSEPVYTCGVTNRTIYLRSTLESGASSVERVHMTVAPSSVAAPRVAVIARQTSLEGTVPWRCRVLANSRASSARRHVEIHNPDLSQVRTLIPSEVDVALAGIDQRLPGRKRPAGA